MTDKFHIQEIAPEEIPEPRRPEPSKMVIFGASGDLTSRKLIPALYSLHLKGRLPRGFTIVGSSRTAYSHEEFRREMRQAVEEFGDDPVITSKWAPFAEGLFYSPGNIKNAEDYEKLDGFLRGLSDEGENADNRLYYLAVAPQFYADAVTNLGAAGMTAENDGWRRIVVEKPFGHDLASAQALNSTIHQSFGENQIYRIDHYLGKETVQNIMVFRFANAIFEPLWNRNYIDHVQITVAESVGIGERGGYYDTAGVLRDMFQNHLLQLLTLTAMEPPIAFEATALRDEKVKVLRALRPIGVADTAERTVRGQYVAGQVMGEKVRGYRDETDIGPNSQTATYAALKLHIDNWRWQGVPFYLRSGKQLATKTTQIMIQFKCAPHLMFSSPAGEGLPPNLLGICIQPDEGMHLRFETKVPGAGMTLRSVDMEFHHRPTFGEDALPSAYERLLLDALQGDQSLFARSDEIELAWSLVDSIHAGWETDAAPELDFYEPGGWGPDTARHFIGQDGRRWREVCGH
ncbi:MAG: Glucose-6-phosphate 1-dehydrogenase 2 [Anaerolineales bacterium]|nr:Glucose-6-phosphate 1-dehydrogenase 2 [Anaerolineales bacterium]